MFGPAFYHGTTRKVIVAFGSLFSNIKIQRFNSTTNLLEQLIDVPISYGNREKWLQRIKEEANTDQRVLITLPRIGFEIVGMQYDPSRKLNKLTQFRSCITGANGNVLSAYAPVPYNLTFQVSIMTKTQDDMFQIVEQIIPFFGPQYNLTINAIPEMGMLQDIPITINSIQIEDTMEGPMSARREVIGNIIFTAKTEYLGSVDDNSNIILHTKVKIDPMYGQIARQVDTDVVGTIDNYTITEDFFDIPRPIS